MRGKELIKKLNREISECQKILDKFPNVRKSDIYGLDRYYDPSILKLNNKIKWSDFNHSLDINFYVEFSGCKVYAYESPKRMIHLSFFGKTIHFSSFKKLMSNLTEDNKKLVKAKIKSKVIEFTSQGYQIKNTKSNMKNVPDFIKKILLFT